MKMTRFIIIVVSCIGSGCTSPKVVLKWPDVTLANGERLVAVSATFESGQPVSINRMTAGWNIDTADAEGGWGQFSASIGVGAAAIESVSELPVIVLRPTYAEATQIVCDVTYSIVTYPEGTAPDREITVSVTNVIWRQRIPTDPQDPRTITL